MNDYLGLSMEIGEFGVAHVWVQCFEKGYWKDLCDWPTELCYSAFTIFRFQRLSQKSRAFGVAHVWFQCYGKRDFEKIPETLL